MSDAISNILSTCIYRTPGRVGFARGGKLLLKITNIGNISLPFESNSAYAGRCHTTTDLGKVPRVSAHFDRLCVIAYARMTGGRLRGRRSEDRSMMGSVIGLGEAILFPL